jgi:Domain of unknown function (DUF5664)
MSGERYELTKWTEKGHVYQAWPSNTDHPFVPLGAGEDLEVIHRGPYGSEQRYCRVVTPATIGPHKDVPIPGVNPEWDPSGTKEVNPKDMVGRGKLPLDLVPDTIGIYAAMAFAEGASKYGSYNWRVAPVAFSVYLAALRRHQVKLQNGEWSDHNTKIPHLASIIACAGIIADAKACGTLVDDRPPSVDLRPMIEQAEMTIRRVVENNAIDHSPKHNHITPGAEL